MDVVVPEEFQDLYVHGPDRPIVKIPDPVLRQPAAEITRLTNRHRTLADTMVRVMKEAHGIGLAAPQLGILERMIVISPKGKPLVLINPKITGKSGSAIAEEGCLSIPGLYGDVERAERVEVEAFDRKGRPVAYEMEGMSARVVQHEIDHLDGVLFIDRVDVATLHWTRPYTGD